MAEGPESADDASGQAGAALAIGLALGKAKRSRRGRAGAPSAEDIFLSTESRKLELEMHHLRLGHFDRMLTVGLKLMTIAIGIVVAGAVGAMAWQAHEDHGLTIAPFSAPPDLAQRGLTGQVVAARVLDRLSELQAQTVSGRPGSSYADNWGDDIKVEIPETGVSIGELNAYLRQWLGHETRITGEVVRTPAGLSATARAGIDPGKSFEGADADVDRLIGEAAEAVYAATQPYRYAVYLQTHGKPDEALAEYQRLARSGTKEDRSWAYSGWSELLVERGDNKGAEIVIREGLRRGLPMFETGALPNLNTVEGILQHRQAEIDSLRLNLLEARRTGKGNAFVSNAVAVRVLETALQERQGDYRSAASAWTAVGDLTAEGGQVTLLTNVAAAESLMLDHDVSGGLATLGSASGGSPDRGARAGYELNAQFIAATLLEDWAGLVSTAEQAQGAAQASGPVAKDNLERLIWPNLAIGYARLGRTVEAEALAARTPLDCDACVEARAQVAAITGDKAGADRWFAILTRRTPDYPPYASKWGEAMLARGDVAGALARLAIIRRKAPHFADPMELWGEALMRQGDVAGSVAKFRAADKDAPRWGRNHLRWGQALAKLGRKDEARAQFQAAKGLDLSVADRAAVNAELAKAG